MWQQIHKGHCNSPMVVSKECPLLQSQWYPIFLFIGPYKLRPLQLSFGHDSDMKDIQIESFSSSPRLKGSFHSTNKQVVWEPLPR